jgi:hypothetical protein
MHILIIGTVLFHAWNVYTEYRLIFSHILSCMMLHRKAGCEQGALCLFAGLFYWNSRFDSWTMMNKIWGGGSLYCVDADIPQTYITSVLGVIPEDGCTTSPSHMRVRTHTTCTVNHCEIAKSYRKHSSGIKRDQSDWKLGIHNNFK